MNPRGARFGAAAKRAGRNQSAFLDREHESVTTGVFDAGNAAFAKIASG